jgi:Ca2+-binding EF-hand superfamily protein
LRKFADQRDGKGAARRLNRYERRKTNLRLHRTERQMTIQSPQKALISALALAAFGTAGLTAAHAQTETQPAPPAFDFAAMDSDGDGNITKAEAQAFATAQMTAIDTDNDGTLSAAELAAHHVARAAQSLQMRADARAAQMIKRLDTDGNGVLSLAEAQAAPQQGKMFDRMDADSDGVISAAVAEAATAKMAARMEKGHGGGMMHRMMGGDHHGRDEGGKGGFGGFW